jgi:UDP-N-acetylmuramoyl-tripeptide--D-alanyl-D-alanine ligase
MRYLLSLVKPRISIITDITQRYLESFSDMDDLSQEYEFLAKHTAKGGLVILNHDNIRLRGMAGKTRSRVETFGFSEGSDWRISGIEKNEKGQSFKVSHKNMEKEYSIDRFGQHHILARAAGEIIRDNLKIINNK